MATISTYASVYDNAGRETTLDAFLAQIKDGDYKDEVLRCRELYAAGDDVSIEAAKKIKLGLPCATISGLFTNGRKAAYLSAHSGYIAADLDNLMRDGYDMPFIKADLNKDQYVYAVGDSISGNGLFVIFKIEGDRHGEAFDAIKLYIAEKYALDIDKSCKDVSRLRIISYDPDLEIHTKAKVFKAYIKKKKPAPVYKARFASRDNVTRVLEEYIATRPDFTGQYESWRNIGFAIASFFGEAGRYYFEDISSNSSTYEQKNVNAQYSACLRSENHRAGSRIGIGTLMYFAREAGVFTRSRRDDIIASTYQNYYKNYDGDKDRAIATTIQKGEAADYTPQQALEIISQIGDGDDLVMAGEDHHENLKVWLQAKDIWKDTIVNRTMIGEDEFTTEHLNKIQNEASSVWRVQERGVFRINPDSVKREIYSTDIRQINRIDEFAKFHKNDKLAVSEISKLAACLVPKNGDRAFVEKYLRKWLVGFWALHYGKVCPLVMVMMGEQGIGKTTFFSNLLPESFKRYQRVCDITKSKLDKDLSISMCRNHLIIFDDMGTNGKMHDEDLKHYATLDFVSERAPYEREPQTMKRKALLCGTTNADHILSDPTGNRRIVPLDIADINHELYNSIDKEKVFIEALQAYLAGESFQITRENMADFAAKTEAHKVESAEEDVINKYFKKPKNETSFADYYVSASLLQAVFDKHRIQTNVNLLGKALKNAGFTQIKIDNTRLWRLCKSDEPMGDYFRQDVEDASHKSERIKRMNFAAEPTNEDIANF